MNPWDVEMVVAEEACRHAEAVASINPYSEAEWIAIGNTRCVYAGSSSSVFGVYSFQESHWEEREWKELERFFQQKERPPTFWVTSQTPADLLERISTSHRCTKIERIYGIGFAKEAPPSTKTLSPTGEPLTETMDGKTFHALPLADLDRWTLLFSQRDNPSAKEPSYLASVKLHQKEIRFYENGKEASYTFFSNGFAYVPYPAASLREWQITQAKNFRATAYLERQIANDLLLGSESQKNVASLKSEPKQNDFELILERKLYEPI